MSNTAKKMTSAECEVGHGQRDGSRQLTANSEAVEVWVKMAVARVLLDGLDVSPELRYDVCAALEDLGCRPSRGHHCPRATTDA